jgi:hypothetical protein
METTFQIWSCSVAGVSVTKKILLLDMNGNNEGKKKEGGKKAEEMENE